MMQDTKLILPLSKQEKDLFELLTSKGVPEEWAWIIVERDDGILSPRNSYYLPPSELLMRSFSWTGSPEGAEFWNSVWWALADEEDNARKQNARH